MAPKSIDIGGATTFAETVGLHLDQLLGNTNWRIGLQAVVSDAQTGVVSFTLSDGSVISTADLRGTDGTNGIDGTNGTNGIDGTNGTNGTNGAVGPAGANGTNGVDGADADFFSTTLGDGVADTFTVTHNLGSQDVISQTRVTATGEMVVPYVIVTDLNTLSVEFATAPAAGEYTIVVTGVAA